MKREFTCIVCPVGCDITAEYEGAELLSAQGNRCAKGLDYVRQELRDPRRTIASSVLVEGGSQPLCSVRLTAPVPRDRLMDVMAEINRVVARAPLHIHDVLIRDVLGLGSDVIATKNVPLQAETEGLG